MNKLSLTLFVSCAISINAWSSAYKIYLSPQGKDSNSGTLKQPVASIDRAIRLTAAQVEKKDVQLIFMDGVYYLNHPITLTSDKSMHITFKALHQGKAVISGGQKLSLKWALYKNGIYSAKISPEIKNIDQLYINGKCQRMARYPNAVKDKNIFDTWNLGEKPVMVQDPLDAKRIATWQNPKGAYLHAMHNSLWGDMHWQILGKNADGTLNMIGGWQNNRPSKMHQTYRMIENIFEELDAPQEWFFDETNHILYYYPEADTKMNKALVEVVVLDNLFRAQGTSSHPIQYINWEGLVFRQTARSFMLNKEPLLRSDWTMYRGGAIVFENAADCSIKQCEFDQVGGNAIVTSNYNQRLLIESCYIHDSGANGVVFVGNPSAVRSPLFRYGKQNYETIDRMPGTKNNDYPQNCKVEDCLIIRTGRYEKQTAPVQISMAYHITVSHCSIYDVPRAGININEGTFGGHVIEYCDVFNTVLETGDHGSFNSWGRDRYWTPDCRQTEQEVRKDTLLPHLDMLAPNVIRNSRWRCDHGWDIDLDDGSSYYHIYNNVLLNRGLKLREGYGRVVENNIILNNSLHPHVWYGNSGDVVRQNIFFSAYMPALMTACIAADGKWGKEVDYNFFIRQSDKDKFQKNGCDIHSLVGNPMFVDAEHGNYRLMPQSTVFKLGFKNIEMNFGVRSPWLKKMAKQPVLPKLILEEKQEKESEHLELQGLTLKNLETMGEQSAVGTKDLCGLLVLAVTYNSPWAAVVRTNDVILEYNGKSVCSLADIKKISAGKSMKIWRNQQMISVDSK